MEKIFVYAGSWWADKEPTSGISLYDFDAETGAPVFREHICEELSVGAVWIDEKNLRLYASDEVENHPDFRRGGGGQIVSFSIDPSDGNLSEISRSPSYGSNPCSLVTDRSGRFLLAANHGGRGAATYTETGADGRISIRVKKAESSIVLFPIAEDGKIGSPCDLLRLTGEGPGPNQYGPHAHSIRRSPDGSVYAVCNQGADRILMLKLNPVKGKILSCGEPFHCTPGSHPRYSVFHPSLPLLYVDKETTPIVSVFRYNSSGELKREGSFSSVPEEITLPSGFLQTDLCIDKKGTVLYVLIRQLNLLRVFRIDQETGLLTPVQLVRGVPDYARACALSPDGRFLLTASYRGGMIASYPVLPDGTLGESAVFTRQSQVGTLAFFKA